MSSGPQGFTSNESSHGLINYACCSGASFGGGRPLAVDLALDFSYLASPLNLSILETGPFETFRDWRYYWKFGLDLAAETDRDSTEYRRTCCVACPLPGRAGLAAQESLLELIGEPTVAHWIQETACQCAAILFLLSDEGKHKVLEQIPIV